MTKSCNAEKVRRHLEVAKGHMQKIEEWLLLYCEDIPTLDIFTAHATEGVIKEIGFALAMLKPPRPKPQTPRAKLKKRFMERAR